MDQKSKEKILKYWGVQAGEISKLSEQAILVKDITNEKYVLKRKLDIQVARNELAILQYLQGFDISVPTPMLSKKNTYIIDDEGRYFSLYTYLPGRVFSAREIIENPLVPQHFGRTLAMLHQLLSDHPLISQFPTRDVYQSVYHFARKAMDKVESRSDRLDQIYQDLESEFQLKVNNLPKQIIHRDAHLSNFIYGEKDLLGVIDYELAEVNVRIFDLCYCATSVLNEVFHDKKLSTEWFPFVEKLVDSYHQKNPLSKLEYDAIWYVMLAIQSIFMAYFAQIPHLFDHNQAMFLWLFDRKELFKGSVKHAK